MNSTDIWPLNDITYWKICLRLWAYLLFVQINKLRRRIGIEQKIKEMKKDCAVSSRHRIAKLKWRHNDFSISHHFWWTWWWQSTYLMISFVLFLVYWFIVSIPHFILISSSFCVLHVSTFVSTIYVMSALS